MEIRWLADRSLMINAAGGVLITDPRPGSAPGPEIDPDSTVVTTSHAAVRRSAEPWRGKARVIEGPGEYEISGLGVRGIATPMADASDPRALNTVYVIDAEQLTVCHLGALNGPLTTQAGQLIGHVDVLITPAGGVDQPISADQAAAVARTLEPRVIIPTHPGVDPENPDFSPLDAYVAEIGLPRPDPAPRLSVTRTNIGDAQRLILLRPQGES